MLRIALQQLRYARKHDAKPIVAHLSPGSCLLNIEALISIVV